METIARLNKQGLIELVDVHTGDVVCVQQTPNDMLLDVEGLIRVETSEGTKYLQAGINREYAEKVRFSQKLTKVLTDLVCEHIVCGGTRMSAAKLYDVPYSTFRYWERTDKDFREALRVAEVERADTLAERVIEESRYAVNAKDRMDALKWMSERGNPEKYGSRTKVVGDKNAPVTFLIDTGIRRKGDEGYEDQEMPEAMRPVQDMMEPSTPPQVHHELTSTPTITSVEPAAEIPADLQPSNLPTDIPEAKDE